jgi:hypothetical protein
MAKKGIELDQLKSIIKVRCKTSGWALCIGAGTSIPLFPSWQTLVECVAAQDVGSDLAADLIAKLASEFGYGGLLQAAKDRLKLTDKKFADFLVKNLYSNIQASLNQKEWHCFTNALSSQRIGDLTGEDWQEFINLIKKNFSSVSALQIAEVVSEVIETALTPSAILSFNAEPLLATLINAFTAERLAPSHRQVIDLVTHGISNRRANRIPYYFCHGLLPVPAASSKTNRQKVQSIDKLVFSETSYLQLANSAFSWQSSVFLDVCNSKSIVFIGVSLSDSNMRRWLSWIYANRERELKQQQKYIGESTSHLWINKLPASTLERDWIESMVAHLGVRIVWINSWNEVGQALRLLLGI